MVGCVLVRNGRIVAEGWHRKFGGPHAEVDALADAGRRGIDPSRCAMYVTLEPCCHHGKTPPCVDAILRAKVPAVVAAMVDPFADVSGGGVRALRRAGVEVRVGVCEAEARSLNEPFIKRQATGEPWVIAKWAQTLDGCIATSAASGGDSRWISGEKSRRLVHQLRARMDAVMVGIGTVLADDPLLTARDVPLKRIARRVVIDPHLKLPLKCRLLASLDEAPLTVATSRSLPRAGKMARLQAMGVEIVPLSGEPRLRLRPLLSHMAKAHGATNVLVEGGSKLLGALLAEKCIDQALVFIAPRVLGDPAGIAPVNIGPARLIKHARRLSLITSRRVGDDMLLDYRLPRR